MTGHQATKTPKEMKEFKEIPLEVEKLACGIASGASHRDEGLRLDGGLRIDMIVEDSLIVELKALEVMHPVFEAQLISYLRLTGKRLGLLINFNVPVIKNGIRRIIL